MKDKGKFTKEEFSEKYDRYSPTIYRICALRLGNRQDAEDAVQNTFIKFFYKSPDFDNEKSELAWLIRVAINACSLKRVTRKPLIQPHSAPNPSPVKTASNTEPVFTSTPAAKHMEPVQISPAERSISPDTINISSPHAMIVTTEICVRMLIRLRGFKKL